MALTAAEKRARNAVYQARWRAKRNALAKRAEALERTRRRRGRRARPVDEATVAGLSRMNIEGVEKKLREARFFLRKMSKHECMAFDDKEPFEHYLSAFLTAGMSVREAFHIRQDRKRNEAVKKWKKAWEDQLTPQENCLWDFMRKDRNHEVHRSSSSHTVRTENRELKPGTHSFASSTVTVAGPPDVSLAFIQVPTYNFTIAGTERKVTEACDEYVALLERMVAKFKVEPL